MLEVAARSIRGSAHPYEDRILVDEDIGLFAVADGVTNSSQGSGAVGAELALSLLRENFSDDLVPAISKVNETFVARMQADRGIGETTLTAVYVQGDDLQSANVGDSPAFLVRNGSMQSLAQMDESPYGYITQTIGSPEGVSVHSARLRLEDRDVVIIASDGVEHALGVPLIRRIGSKSKASEVVDATFEEATSNPSVYDDDKSVIVLRVLWR